MKSIMKSVCKKKNPQLMKRNKQAGETYPVRISAKEVLMLPEGETFALAKGCPSFHALKQALKSIAKKGNVVEVSRGGGFGQRRGGGFWAVGRCAGPAATGQPGPAPMHTRAQRSV